MVRLLSRARTRRSTGLSISASCGSLAASSPAGISWSYDIRVVTLDVAAGPANQTSEQKEARWRDPAIPTNRVETDGELASDEIALETAQAVREGGPGRDGDADQSQFGDRAVRFRHRRAQ